jgi:RimJ/RimL family protein N-acetyltransferase
MYKMIFDLCFNQYNINRLWLFVLDYNKIAISLYKKLGFIEEGKQRKAIFRNGNYHDYIMMSLLKTEYESK